MNEPVDVVVAGHLCLDLTPRFPEGEPRPLVEILRPGVLVNVDAMHMCTGGAVSNTGIALRVFGCNVASVAKVGDDAIGSLTLEVLRRYGNAAGVRVTPGETSSYSVVLAAPGVDRVFLHCTGTNDTFAARDVDYGLVAASHCRLFHFGYPPLMRLMFDNGGAELEAMMRRVHETGVTTSLDMAMPDPAAPSGKADWPAILARALPHVDVFVPSIEEAFFCLFPAEYRKRRAAHPGEDLLAHMGVEDYRRVAARAVEMGCAVVALKAGGLGWYLRTAGTDRLRRMGACAPEDARSWAERELWCPAYRVERIASATGSGDSSIAGFLTALLRGRDLEDSLHLANCAGAHNLAGLDAVSGLKSWDIVTTDAARMPLGDIPFLRDTEWRFRADRGVWELPRGGRPRGQEGRPRG